jgi:hypothetical protein
VKGSERGITENVEWLAKTAEETVNMGSAGVDTRARI